MVTDKGRWVMECSCGNVIRQKTLAYIGSNEPCDFCRPVIAAEDDSLGQPSVSGELGWCQCGNPERIDELMLRYLDSVPRWGHPDADIPADERILLAYIADSLGWTDHGTSIGASWLTSEGETARHRLRDLTTVPIRCERERR